MAKRGMAARQISRAIRMGLARPAVLWTTAVITLFTAAISPAHFLASLPFGPRLAINAVNALAFWGLSYGLLGPAIAFGLARGVPWLYTQLVFYVPLALADALIYALYLAPDGTWLTALAAFTAVMSIVVSAVFFTLMMLQNFLFSTLEEAGFPGMLFRTAAPIAQAPSQGHGPPLRLKAANQYVEIIRADAAVLVRMTFKEAVAAQPPRTGTVINRSTWIAWAAIREISEAGDRRQVRLCDGSEVFVSRARVAEFDRDWAAYRLAHNFNADAQ